MGTISVFENTHLLYNTVALVTLAAKFCCSSSVLQIFSKVLSSKSIWKSEFCFGI